MKTQAKDTYLQIRLSKGQKDLITRAAKACGKDVSKWVLEKLVIDKRRELIEICQRLAGADEQKSFFFAELNDFLAKLSSHEFTETLVTQPAVSLSDQDLNILAAMIEHVAHKKNFICPRWTNNVTPLKIPLFATTLTTLKTYLLLNSPIAFRKRNIFVDAGIGDRL